MSGYTRVNGAAKKFSEPEMRKAFEAVQAENWKDPVDAVVAFDDVSVTVAAIQFFAGSEAYLKPLGPSHDHAFHVKAPGYYARVGA